MQSNVIGLEYLKRRTEVTDIQLDQRVDVNDLNDFGQHIVDYKKYGPQLGVSDNDIKEIERDPTLFHSLKDKAVAVFKKWHENKAGLATYRALVDVALKLGDGIGAERICMACAKSKLL